MLRQVFLYLNNEAIFSYFFARAFDSDTLNTVITKKLNSFITNPSEGQTFSKPLFDYQTHFGVFRNVFFLYITDMADRPKVITKEIERAAKLFVKNFPDPLKIKEASPEKEEFVTFIKETFYYLHPKIALMGAQGAGKTTIANILKLKDSPEKTIMNFALYYQIQIRDLNFDLWDFIEKDDFSPLWNNYIRGTDIILYILDASSLNDRREEFFINLQKREGKFSRMAIILTHSDQQSYAGIDGVKKKYPALEEFPFFELCLTEDDAKDNLINILIEAIGIKKPLPPEFRSKLVEANENVSSENYEIAIQLLEELKQMCQEFQELEYVETFDKKIEELKVKLAQKKEKEEQEKSKISAPKQIQFDKFKGVKTLPIGQGKPQPPVSVAPLPTKMQVKQIEVTTLEPATPEEQENVESIPNAELVAEETTQTEILTPPVEPEFSEEETTQPSAQAEIDTSILSGIKSSNPFFNKVKVSEPEPKLTNLPPPPKLPPTRKLVTVEQESEPAEPTENIAEEEIVPVSEEEIVPVSEEEIALASEEEIVTVSEEENEIETQTEEEMAEHQGIKLPPPPKLPPQGKVITASSLKDKKSKIPFAKVEISPAEAEETSEEGEEELTLQGLAAKSLKKTAERTVHLQDHIELQKVKPIDIDALESRKTIESNSFAEQILAQSMNSLKEAKVPVKKITFERSPLIKNEIVNKKVEIKQTNPISAPEKRNPMESFTIEKKSQISEAAEKLGESIRSLGESLSRDLCQKFIDQLEIRLKKTNLSDDDIKQAAELFVKQRRKIASGST